jgi:hypothetical protein
LWCLTAIFTPVFNLVIMFAINDSFRKYTQKVLNYKIYSK